MFWSPIPTTDLYFLNSCHQLVSSYPWQCFDKSKPIKRLGDNTFQCGTKVLVVRRDKEKLLKSIINNTALELIYLIDDNIWQAKNDTSLPEGYKSRLNDFACGMASQLINKASLVVVSNKNLITSLPQNKVTACLHPIWDGVPPSDLHFNNTEIKLVHLGTNSHLAGFEFCYPIIERLLTKYNHVTFSYYSNRPLMGQLDNHPRVKRTKVMRWAKYKKHFKHLSAPEECFHLAIYPIIDTPINSSRSINKILETSLVGCAGVYSKSWNYAQYIKHGTNGLILDNNAKRWIDEISTLIETPGTLHTLYQGSVANFNQLNSHHEQLRFWQQHFVGTV